MSDQHPSGVPAGWYPDPAAPPYTAQRYWDGTRWTEHVAAAAALPTGKATTTPDGVPLAGWWHRVGASLLDSVVLLVPIGLLSAPFVVVIVRKYADFFRATVDAANAGTDPPAASGIYLQILLPALAISAISLVVQVAYHAVMLRWKGATVGKLVVGLRVRLRERPGRLEWPTVWRHVLGQFGYAVITLIPFVGGIAGIYPLLDSLWPLWDDKRQALHDKVAGTNVVRTR